MKGHGGIWTRRRRCVVARGSGGSSSAATRIFRRRRIWTAGTTRACGRVFGYNAVKPLVSRADSLAQTEYRELERRANQAFEDRRQRAKQPRVKEQIVREREYVNKRLVREEVAEFAYKPHAAGRAYRVVVVRKTIIEERGQRCIDQYPLYFFYITNERKMTAEQVVTEANGRCGQEILIEQLKGVRALHAPLNTLEARLGLHGDRFARLVAQGVVRAASARVRTVARPARGRVGTRPADGVPHVRAALHADTGADRAQWTTAHLSTARLAS